MMSVVERVKNVFKGKGREERKRFGALTQDGGELLDSTPMQPPVGFRREPSMFDVMREQMRQYHADLEREGFETPEEADDFDVDDEVDPSSPYEHNFDPAISDVPNPEVPSVASSEAKDPPADGPATPPAPPAPAGSPAPAQGGPA